MWLKDGTKRQTYLLLYFPQPQVSQAGTNSYKQNSKLNSRPKLILRFIVKCINYYNYITTMKVALMCVGEHKQNMETLSTGDPLC